MQFPQLSLLNECAKSYKLLTSRSHPFQETDRQMMVMWEVLQRAGGSAMFVPLVLNHRSFSQMVENIFTLSFLVGCTCMNPY